MQECRGIQLMTEDPEEGRGGGFTLHRRKDSVVVVLRKSTKSLPSKVVTY